MLGRQIDFSPLTPNSRYPVRLRKTRGRSSSLGEQLITLKISTQHFSLDALVGWVEARNPTIIGFGKVSLSFFLQKLLMGETPFGRTFALPNLLSLLLLLRIDISN